MRREGDEAHRAEPEELENDRGGRAAGGGRARYRTDTTASAERGLLPADGRRRWRSAGRGNGVEVLVAAVLVPVGYAAFRGRFRLARLRARMLLTYGTERNADR